MVLDNRVYGQWTRAIMPWRMVYLLLPVFFVAVLVGQGNCEEFDLLLKESTTPIKCRKVVIENDVLQCPQPGANYNYALPLVKSVSRDGVMLYPYKSTMVITLANLASKNCEELFASLDGPLVLENNKQVFLVVGAMYEKGICVKVNPATAKKYYKKAGVVGRQSYDALVQKNKPQRTENPVSAAYLQSLQHSADEKRQKWERWNRKCQDQCTFANDVALQHRYSTGCYDDCMSYLD